MKRHAFVDWMKAVGMFFIVFGHFFGEPYDQLTQPVFPKQLGVCFFVFVMGWGMANETRFKWRVAYNRLFPMYFWGGIIAILLSLVYFYISRDVHLSNYSTFVLGVNVLFNAFPANPTTWFIGTYLHLILLWVIVFSRIKVTPKILLLSLLFELMIRTGIVYSGNLFTSYMVLPNWITIFLLGMYFKDHKDLASSKGLLSWSIGLVAFSVAWTSLLNQFDVGGGFPFRRFEQATAMTNAILVSLSVSVVYITYTLLFFQVFRRIPINTIVQFFARNTIITFIGHMPLRFVLPQIIGLMVPQGWELKLIMVLTMYVGLSLISEGLHRLIDLKALREYMWRRLSGYIPYLAADSKR